MTAIKDSPYLGVYWGIKDGSLSTPQTSSDLYITDKLFFVPQTGPQSPNGSPFPLKSPLTNYRLFNIKNWHHPQYKIPLAKTRD